MSGELHGASLLLQGSACLGLGLIGSYLWARRPARAHQVLLIAMVVCVVLPGLYLGVQALGLGVLQKAPQPSPAPVMAKLSREVTPPIPPMKMPATWEPHPMTVVTQPATSPSTAPPETQVVRALPWSRIMLWTWALLSLWIWTRLVFQFVAGMRLLRRSREVTDPVLLEALDTARQRMGIRRPVRLCSCRTIQSPMIWCWGHRPILLVQPLAGQDAKHCDWTGMFCHELAHTQRRDHLSSLWADLLCTALPWHPLIWWSRQRLIHLCEEICDDWALVRGQTDTAYAASLLTLTTQKQLALMPGIVGKEKSMKARIRRIIKGRINNPRPGLTWTCLVLALTFCATVGIALAQPRREEPQRRLIGVPQPVPKPEAGRADEFQAIEVGTRLKVLHRLLDQLNEQVRDTQAALEQAQQDEERHAREVELDTLRDQIALIERQIERTQHPEPEQPVYASGPGPQERINELQAQIAQTEQRLHALGDASPDRAQALREHLDQMHAEIGTIKDKLRQDAVNRYSAVNPYRDTYDSRDRMPAPDQQMKIYSLQHSIAGQIAATLTPIIDGAMIIPDDNTNSLIIKATPDQHQQIQQLLQQLDRPGRQSTVNALPMPRSTSRNTIRMRSGDTPERNLNAEVDDLRGQVQGLNDQIQALRSLLEQVIRQQHPDHPDNQENLH